MALNIFEGARRIAKLVAVLWIVGIVGISVFTFVQVDPYITATYQISASDRLPVRSDPSCKYNLDIHHEAITVKTKKGTEANVELCFLEKVPKFTVTSPDGQKYVVTGPEGATEQQAIAYAKDRLKLPTSAPSGTLSGAGKDKASSEEKDWKSEPYTKDVKKSFVLSQTDEEWIDDQWWAKRWGPVRQGLLVLGAGVVFLWGFTWAMGWIVRGFLGIPRGQDRKTQ